MFTLFDVEKLDRLPLRRQMAVSRYLKALPVPPVFAVLFGSTAKENYQKDSDMDILIVTNDKIDPKEAEREADAMSAIKISTFQIGYNNFLKELKLKDDKVVQSAINSGYPLINHLSYYGVWFDERI